MIFKCVTHKISMRSLMNMRKPQLVLALFGLSVALSGCGGLEYSLSAAETSTSIPEEFYYHTSGSCTDGSFSFKGLQGSGIMLWTDPANVLVGQVELYLSKDSTYTLRYREFTFDAQAYDTQVSGGVEVDDKTGVIAFENLGNAFITTENGRQVLQMTFNRSINNSLLKNQSVNFRTARVSDPSGTTVPDYCHYN